jgi:glutathione-specific gamma-glutamylcyclotransferase
MADLWVFGYGSLMWRPGFAHIDVQPATLVGYRRCFCIYSVHHRGTPQRPGLVLGLDRGGVCHGMAFQVPMERAAETLTYLRAREQVNGVYREAVLPVQLSGGTEVGCMAYIAERCHPSFAGQLSIRDQALLIRAARGQSGTNFDYLVATLAHLGSLGIRERELERVASACGPVFARPADGQSKFGRTAGLLRYLQPSPVGAPVMRLGERRRFMHRQRVKGSA